MTAIDRARAEHTRALQAWIAAKGDDIDRLRPELDRARAALRDAVDAEIEAEQHRRWHTRFG